MSCTSILKRILITGFTIFCGVVLAALLGARAGAVEFTSGDVQSAYDHHNIRQLMALASDPEKPIRLQALESLVRLNDPQVIPFLAQQIDDTDTDIVEFALWGLPPFGSSAATPEVIVRLQALDQHPTRDVRRVADIVLADLQDPEKWQQMRSALASKETDERKEALGFFIKRLDLSILFHARDLLQDSDSTARQTAVVLVHGLDDRDSLPVIEKLLGDASPSVRAAAVLVVGDWKEESAYDLLAPALKDADPLVRASAVTALGNHQNMNISLALTKLNRDASPNVRIALARALAKFATPVSAGVLLDFSLDDNALVRDPAIAGLAGMRDSSVTQKMTGFLADKDSRRRRRAAILYFSQAEGLAQSNLLIPRLHDPDAEVRLGAVQTLLQTGDSDAKARLIYLLNDPNPNIRLTILKQIPDLLKLPGLNRAVLKKNLIRLQPDPSPEVQSAVSEAFTLMLGTP